MNELLAVIILTNAGKNTFSSEGGIKIAIDLYKYG